MWVELVTSVLGGGVTGLIGSLLTRWFDYKAQQQKQAHEVAMRRVDAEIMAQEWTARTRVAEVEASGREAVADAQAFEASFNEPARYSDGTAGGGWLVMLDVVRGLVRPSLTVYLCVLTTMIYVQARWLLGPGVSPDSALQVVSRITETILYLTTCCVLWWFGTRVKAQPKL